MLELATTLISNGIVAGLLIYSIKRSGKQEKALNTHIVNFTKEITNRPDFDQMDKRIDKTIKPVCKKTDSLVKDFKGHRHEGKQESVVLGV